MRAHILCCMLCASVSVCLCLSVYMLVLCLILILLLCICHLACSLFSGLSLCSDHHFYAVLCMCPHAHQCLPLSLAHSLCFDTKRRFTKNEIFERNGKLRVEKENFNKMKWTEKNWRSNSNSNNMFNACVCWIEYSFETFRCAPPYICFGVV